MAQVEVSRKGRRGAAPSPRQKTRVSGIQEVLSTRCRSNSKQLSSSSNSLARSLARSRGGLAGWLAGPSLSRLDLAVQLILNEFLHSKTAAAAAALLLGAAADLP